MDINQEIAEKLADINKLQKAKTLNQQTFDKLIELYSDVLTFSYYVIDANDISIVLKEFANFVEETAYKYDLLSQISQTQIVAQQRKSLDVELECLCLKGWYFFKNNDMESAIGVLQEAQSKNKNHGNKEIRIKINIYFALIYKGVGWYEKSMEFLNKIEQLFRNKELAFTREFASYYNILGTVCREDEQYDKAFEHYEKSLDCYNKMNDKIGIAKVSNNMGILCQRQKKAKKALAYLNKALSIKKKMNVRIDTTLAVIGDVHLEQMELKKAEEAYQKVFETRHKKPNIKGIISIENAFGRLYLKQKKYEDSEKILKKCEKKAEENALDNLLEENYMALVNLYKQTKNYMSAFEYSQKQQVIRKKIQSDNFKKQLVVNDTFNRLQEKELEIERQKEKTSEVKHRIKNHFGVLNGLISQLKRRSIEQAGIDKVAACIKAMTALYDMLYEVNELEPTANLGDFLAKLIKKVREVHQNLSEDAQRIKIEMALDKNIVLKASSCLELGLVLAEIMTNSYKYAFNDFDETQMPLISICLTKNEEEKKIILEVKDNGCGWQQEEIEKRKDSFGKIFIRNYVEQLDGEIEWPKMNEKGACYQITIPM